MSVSLGAPIIRLSVHRSDLLSDLLFEKVVKESHEPSMANCDRGPRKKTSDQGQAFSVHLRIRSDCGEKRSLSVKTA